MILGYLVDVYHSTTRNLHVQRGNRTSDLLRQSLERLAGAMVSVLDFGAGDLGFDSHVERVGF